MEQIVAYVYTKFPITTSYYADLKEAREGSALLETPNPGAFNPPVVMVKGAQHNTITANTAVTSLTRDQLEILERSSAFLKAVKRGDFELRKMHSSVDVDKVSRRQHENKEAEKVSDSADKDTGELTHDEIIKTVPLAEGGEGALIVDVDGTVPSATFQDSDEDIEAVQNVRQNLEELNEAAKNSKSGKKK